MSVESQLKEILSDMLGINEQTITNESTADTLGMDSLDSVEFIMSVEEEFDIEIPSEDEHFENFGQLVTYVTNKK